jgi:diguanylate cyclase (GGDEF)-like protein/PAS domain S-box-containing protein
MLPSSSCLSLWNAWPFLSVAGAACLLGILFAISFRLMRERDRLLRIAVSNMSQGLLMFDMNAKLVVCNRRYLEMYSLSAKIVKPGCSLHELIAHRIENGSFESSDPEQYIRNLRLAISQGKTVNKIVELTDGRTISVSSRPTADGGWVATHEDITERRKSERELERTRKFLNAVIENIPATILVKHANDFRIALINSAGEQLFGVSREQIVGRTTRHLSSAIEADFMESRDAEALKSGQKILVSDFEIHTPQNGVRTVTSKKLAILNDDRTAEYVLSVIEDVTDRKFAEDALRQTQIFLDTVIEHAPSPIVVKDAKDYRYLLVNRAAEELFGIARDRIIGRTAHEILPTGAAEMIAAHDEELMESIQKLFFSENLLETPNNGTRLVIMKRIAIRGNNGLPKYLLDVIEDITERKEAESKIAYMASHDALTDLPNRAAFEKYLALTVESAAASHQRFAVLCMDLDRFKEVNDVFGHSVGDALLREVANRLRIAAEDTFLARLGGDEFMLVVVADAQPGAAEAVAHRLVAAVAGELGVEGHQLRTCLSIGVAIFPNDGSDANTLLVNADAALYRAKAEGRGSIRFFEADMDRQLRERQALQQDLRSAISAGQMAIHYQPQARIDGEIIGFEALARWKHPKYGFIPPARFIPIAEESGLIISIGHWILREACREAASWPRPLQIAINLSPAQFRHGDLPGMTHAILLETGLAAQRLELEITENVLIDDFSRALSILRRLKSLGVRIAMDDFGTGYSSLSYLQSFPFDKIKIDRSFISGIKENVQSSAIVRAVINLGRGLQLPVVAEGVETKDQLKFLSEEACDEIQGYFVGRPKPIYEYAEMVGKPREAANLGREAHEPTR